jgi:uncharacterized protein YfiM (DUF2279 family)
MMSLSSAGQVQTDKAWHVAAGTVISAAATGVTYHLTDRKDVSLLVGFLSGTAAGLAKELWDAKGHGVPSADDLAWTICGAGFGSFSITIIIDKQITSRKAKLWIMKNSEKIKAEKKADIALCKLQDLFYLNISDRVASRLNEACDKVREVIDEIEKTEIK